MLKAPIYTSGLNLNKKLSVTIPYKSSVFPLLDEIDGPAERIGAVNTIVNDNGRLIGYNTDAIGAVRALEKKIDLRLRRGAHE
jgi:shikimate dehydrogenase